MKNQEVINHLTRCRSIAPRKGFANVSRRSILLERQEVVFPFDAFLRPLWVGSFAALFLVTALSYALFSGSRPSYASLDARRIQHELDELTISIELKEIAYSQSADRAVASALQEITNDKIRHLNLRVLEGEQEGMFQLPEADTRIDALLQTVIF